jgi:hypothetical protein
MGSGDETTWMEAALLMVALLGAGFLVSWLATDVWPCSRRTYIAVLGLVTVVATALVAGMTGTSLYDMAVHRWVFGLVAGIATGIVLGVAMRKHEPATARLEGPALRAAAMWEGLIYGLAEGVLLSGLPVLVMREAAADAGWTGLGAWLPALMASAVMIVVHHFGYWAYRGPQVGLVIVACGLLSISYVVTGSLVAPALGHVVLHLFGVTAGVVLPPHPRRGVAAAVGA